MNFKKALKLGLITIFAVGLTAGCGCTKKNKDKKDDEQKETTYNTNEGVVEDKEVSGLKLTNTSLASTGDNATLVTLVSNPTDKDIEVRIFKIHVKDKDGNIIVDLEGYVGDVVPAGESREITSNVTMNLDAAASIEYELVKD